jgi:hypothetical protein
MRLIKVLYLSSKNGENGTGRVTGLQLDGKGVRGNVFLCLLFVLFQSSGKDRLKVRGRSGSGRNLGHRVVEGA